MPRVRVTPGNPQLDLFGTTPVVDPLRPVPFAEMIAVVKAAPPTEIEQYAKRQGWDAPVPAPGHAPAPAVPAMRRTRVPRAEPTQAPDPAPAPLPESNVARAIEQSASGEPWSHFTKSRQLNADEATRAVQGRTLGYVGVRFHKSRAVLCRDCHEGLIKGTARFIPDGFDGQGYQATVYACEQRKPNVAAKCAVCGVDVIGEVAGG